MSERRRRSRPNVLITGTTGTGKSLTSSEVSSQTGLTCVDVGAFAKRHELVSGWDEEYKCHILDEDMIIDELEAMIQEEGVILEYHSCDFFPKRWFDAIFVLRTDNTILYDRLQKRGYCGKKLEDNIQCEIFQTVLEEARVSYDPAIVHELRSDFPEDLDQNVECIQKFISDWCSVDRS